MSQEFPTLEGTVEKKELNERLIASMEEMIESLTTNSAPVKAFRVFEDSDEDVKDALLESITGEISMHKALLFHPDVVLYQALSERLNRAKK